MEITMKDFFDDSRESLNTNTSSAERITVLTMEKINQANKPKRSISRIVGIAAVIAIILTVSLGVYADRIWSGFMNTKGMSEQEILEIIRTIERSGCFESTDSNGNTHYYDSYGNEIMVLSPSEVKQFEQLKEKERVEQCQAGAGDMLDVGTLELLPFSITPVATNKNGEFEDFLLSVGNMVLLHPKGDDGYQLKKGDTVIISLDASNACWLSFGVVRDGKMVDKSATKTQFHEFEYTIIEDGQYNFTLMYTSSDADNFINCSITIN